MSLYRGMPINKILSYFFSNVLQMVEINSALTLLFQKMQLRIELNTFDRTPPMKRNSWLTPPPQLQPVRNDDGSSGAAYTAAVSSVLRPGEKENNILAIECPFLINNIKLSSYNTCINLCNSRNTSLAWYDSWFKFILQSLSKPGKKKWNKPNQTRPRHRKHFHSFSWWGNNKALRRAAAGENTVGKRGVSH